LVVAAEPVSGPCNSKQQLSQKYSVNFVSSDSQQQPKSGNPGYINGLPLLVGKLDSVSGGVQSYNQGFRLTGADLQGNCFTSNPASALTIAGLGDPYVTFGEDLLYSCSVSLNESEL
jgi:hypothetical protein